MSKGTLKISNSKDKILIKEVISKYLEIKNINEVARVTNISRSTIQEIFRHKSWVRKLFNEETLEIVTQLLEEEEEKLRREQEEISAKEYEKLMANILDNMIHSLYNYDEMCENLHICIKTLKDMIDNEKYIKEHFGEQMLQELKLSKDRRNNLPYCCKRGNNTCEIVKDPKCRQIIKPDIIKTSKYEYELIKKAVLFLEHSGDSKKVVNSSGCPLNEIITSLADPKLKELLLEDVYEEVQELLEIESILTQNRMIERKVLIGNVVLSVHRERGNINRIKTNLGYTEDVIRRILEHPYVSIICNSLNINVSVDMLHYEEKSSTDYCYPFYYFDSVGKLVEIDMKEVQLILDIADFIIESNATYAQAAQKFGFSKKTICVKMKNKLPYISKTKSKEINKIVNGNTAKNVENDEELQERVLLESKLLLRGYTIKQVAYLVNNKYSSTQRDLSQRLPQLSEEKGQLVKTMLKYNQAYKNQ